MPSPSRPDESDENLSGPRHGAGLVVYRDTGGVDAITEYSLRLVRALCAGGTPARFVPDGLPGARRVASRPPWILLQYNPFSYGSRGVAPRLIVDALSLRRNTGAFLAVLVHETWVDARDWRTALMGAYQRLQLQALLRAADGVIVTTEAYGRAVGRPALHVPVGSNITPQGLTKERARDRLGLRDAIVVTLFGTRHPDRALEYAEAAIASLAERHGVTRLKVFNLGADTPELTLAPEIAVETPGRLDADALSVRLHASDVLLLPFIEGLSSRRTTLMAALSHGVPVVGLSGPSTDSGLRARNDALRLSPVGDVAQFARVVVELCDNPDALAALGRAGQEVYRSSFDWPVVARRVSTMLERESVSSPIKDAAAPCTTRR